MALKGIDVSNWQGRSFDWEAEQDLGVQFAFIKATEGTTYLDPDFGRNWVIARQRGIPVRGAYHFFHPALPPAEQARFFLGHVRAIGLEPGDLLMLDHEDTDGLVAAQVAAAAREFTGEVNRATGASCVVYTNRDLAARGYCEGLGGSPLFLAVPGVASPQPVPPWDLLSFAQTGQRRGVDQDTGYFDSAAQLRRLGVPAPSSAAAPASAPPPGASPAPAPGPGPASGPGPVPPAAPVTPPAAALTDAVLTSAMHLDLAGTLLQEAERIGGDLAHDPYTARILQAATHALIGIGHRLGL